MITSINSINSYSINSYMSFSGFQPVSGLTYTNLKFEIWPTTRKDESINVVLDIDGVLAAKTVENLNQAAFFKNKGAIITAIKTHYVFPGVVELIKLLFQTENIKVSFFSAGEKERNTIFVEQLLKLALSESKYEKVKHTVRVLSRDDMIITSDMNKEAHFRIYDLIAGDQQKDISKVLSFPEKLENAVLIDDDSSYVACGQAKNILHVPKTKVDLSSKVESYQPQGYRYLNCFFSNEESSSPKWVKEHVKEGKQILIVKTIEGFEIGFLDKSSRQYKQRLISQENGQLIVELDKIYQSNNNTEKKNVFKINNKELIKNICEFVDSLNGYNRKICRSLNRIYYATGLLFTALRESKSNNISVSESLFRLQFKLKEDGETYKPNFKLLSKVDDFYIFGLEKLKEINNNLRLTTPHTYLECTKIPTSEDERSALEAVIENQTGCYMM